MIKINWDKEGRVPAIIQDLDSREVLMLGYMNEAALKETLDSGYVTFYSRSKERLWTKGESSGNRLEFVGMKNDCDQDALLIQVRPQGPTCHTGTQTCWGNTQRTDFSRLEKLERVIAQRKESGEDGSYVSQLFQSGIHKVAQKVGEEATEVVIEACYNYEGQGKSKSERDVLFLNESADLLFHYLILLQAKGFALEDVLTVLSQRAAE